MVQGACRIRDVSLLAIVFLFFCNIILIIKLASIPNCKEKNIQKQPNIIYTKCQRDIPRDPHETDLKLDLSLGRWDTEHKYKLFDFILVGEKYILLNDLYKTCLATQSSLDKLSSIVEVSNHWNGPISLAVFAACEKELNLLLLYIIYLRKCNSKIRDKVSFHLVIPKERQPKQYQIDHVELQSLDCIDPIEILKLITKEWHKSSKQWRSKLPYPQNHLRNLARKNCQTKFMFLTDVDIIPSRGMAESLDVFLEKYYCKSKCAFVVPTYELDERVQFPHNKTELVRLAGKSLARPFHHKVFIYNQYATNFSRWQNQVDEDPDIHISHPVTNFEFLYEPFYIASDTVPPHDERFVGYGYTRNSQVYEMFVAGYDFLVLSPIFTCHWGLQVKRTRPPWREHQNNVNRKQFDGFKKEIFAKYNKDPLNMMNQKRN